MEFLLSSSSLSVSDDGIIRCVRSKVIEVLRARGAGGQVRRIPDLYGLGVLYNDSSMLQLQEILFGVDDSTRCEQEDSTGFVDWVVVVFRI